MKIVKSSMFRSVLFAVVFTVVFVQLTGCKKETITNTVTDTTYYDVTCPVRGTYIGNNTASTGGTSPIVYTFEDNNFVVGRVTVGGPAITFGGYRNTCDSVIMSVNYTGNGAYYLLKGKFSNNRNTIAGSFNNLTTPSDFGTFTMSK